jgi:hypothetical protein
VTVTTESRHALQAHLEAMLGPDAEFREGQWEAVEALVDRRERALGARAVLTAQRPRDHGRGPGYMCLNRCT